jgi:hypothetical protein
MEGEALIRTFTQKRTGPVGRASSWNERSSQRKHVMTLCSVYNKHTTPELLCSETWLTLSSNRWHGLTSDATKGCVTCAIVCWPVICYLGDTDRIIHIVIQSVRVVPHWRRWLRSTRCNDVHRRWFSRPLSQNSGKRWCNRRYSCIVSVAASAGVLVGWLLLTVHFVYGCLVQIKNVQC